MAVTEKLDNYPKSCIPNGQYGFIATAKRERTKKAGYFKRADKQSFLFKQTSHRNNDTIQMVKRAVHDGRCRVVLSEEYDYRLEPLKPGCV